MPLSPRRWTTLLTTVGLFSSLLLVGCEDRVLTALRPQFDISWSEDQGFVPGSLDESLLFFGAVPTATSASIEVQLRNGGNATLDVCDIYLASVTFDEDDAVASEIRVEADLEIATNFPGGESDLPNGSTVTGELRFTPLFGTALAPDLHLVVKHELNWNCGSDSGEGLYIPIVGEGDGDPAPDIYAKPGMLEFPNTPVGTDSSPLALFLGNQGPGLLELGNISIDDPTHFTLQVNDAIGAGLNTGDTEEMSVVFSPQSPGEHSATIAVASNDADENPLLIPLFGVGDTIPLGKNPIAVCGIDYESQPFATEQFDGSASYDPSGLTLSYDWLLTPPPGSTSTLSSASSPTPTVTLDLAGDYAATLTVYNTAGQSDSCTQTVSAIPNENFRIEMFWAQSDDMDLHLLAPGGIPRTDTDCYYANCTWTYPDWGQIGFADDNPSLDLDDISGLGPENINIVAPANGLYTVFVHDYTGSTTDTQGPNDVTVNAYLNGVLTQTFNFQISGDGDDYYVATIDWPSGTITPCFGLGGC